MSVPQLQPPARADRLSDQVATQIQQLVMTNAIRAGEKLPSERELCELLGVSRTVVREAVRSLVAKGLLEVRRGGGTLVRSPDPALVSEMMAMMLHAGGRDVAFSHVHEVRRLLEVEIAGLAAERRDESDLQHMREQLQRMHENAADPERWAEADVAFHAAIATATNNPLYPLLLGSIADMLIEVRRTGIQLPETPAKAYQHHQRVLERIAARDRAGARKAMQDHLRESEQTFQKARFHKTSRAGQA
ncbi:MAG TPA: FadR/GntR family transcriptional regulator [Roseiflexaceae bacterium]|nr:FadR/GntR family transcriptional regulator [Roseiflexaceae bacterium]